MGRVVVNFAGSLAIVAVSEPIRFVDNPWYGISNRELTSTLRGLATDSRASAVLLDMNCPGGEVAGSDDLTRAVLAVKAAKPIHAFAHGTMASLAYWMGCLCTTVSAAPAAIVGSVGVLAMLYDESGMYEKMGVKVHGVSSGPAKLIGASGLPITEDGIKYVDRIVQAQADLFINAVAEARRMTPEAVRAMGGACYCGEQAVAAGLVDRIVSFDVLVAELSAAPVTKALSPTPGAPPAPGARAMSTVPNTLSELKVSHPDLFAQLQAQAEAASKAAADAAIAAATAKIPVPATTAELKTAFPDDPAFCFEAMSTGMTLDAAKAAHALIASRVAAAGKPASKAAGLGTAPVGGTVGTSGGPATYAEAARAIAKREKLDFSDHDSKCKAMAMTNREYPELHAEWRAAGFPAVA